MRIVCGLLWAVIAVIAFFPRRPRVIVRGGIPVGHEPRIGFYAFMILLLFTAILTLANVVYHS